MALLYNRVSQKELKERLLLEAEKRCTISFYRYLPIEDPGSFRDNLYKQLDSLNVFGRIYVAREGINGQVSVPRQGLDAFKTCLDSVPGLGGLRLNKGVDDGGKSFWVLKIKVRAKIVADGIEDPDFDMSKKGSYLTAAAFNQLAEKPGTLIVDMRNHYEFEVGHFAGAMEIPSDTFREQLPMAASMLQDKKDADIIMYCTGGIRCEKASAYMLHRGFKHVFHLEGGIIHYANTVKEQEMDNKFLGKNFVFDDRLGEKISHDIISRCHQCGEAADTHTNCKNEACHLLFIQCPICAARYNGCCSPSCQQVHALPGEQQRELRKGKQNELMGFNKSKKRLMPKMVVKSEAKHTQPDSQ